ncbi:MAG: cell filamentation protein Fic [Armatimonadetes bacterium RBG_16_58_9]|nr:MAG: cell filamentation protein Fic [Armatimonadetes bacterium RBG_16_58_9]
MMSFRDNRIAREPVPMHTLRLVGKINQYKGMQQPYHQQAPQILESLRQVAVVQSTESSNRIEGIEVPASKLNALMADKAAPRNRPEGEIAGYRDVLATIHASHPHIPVTPNTILQLHRDLYKFVPSEGGAWKSVDNTIDDMLPDGTHRVRFQPVSAVGTPSAVEELCSSLGRHSSADDVDPLLLGATFVFDFLCIHPFRDGNGRMSRLLALLLLYAHGYEVGRYISIERIIEESKESYYEALAKSSGGWHEGTHTLLPWWDYHLGTILAAYGEFESRAGLIGTGRGRKTEMVRGTVERMVGAFSISELMALCPSVSRDMIRTVLEKMRDDGLVECIGSGRSATWRKTVAS